MAVPRKRRDPRYEAEAYSGNPLGGGAPRYFSSEAAKPVKGVRVSTLDERGNIATSLPPRRADVRPTRRQEQAESVGPMTERERQLGLTGTAVPRRATYQGAEALRRRFLLSGSGSAAERRKAQAAQAAEEAEMSREQQAVAARRNEDEERQFIKEVEGIKAGAPVEAAKVRAQSALDVAKEQGANKLAEIDAEAKAKGVSRQEEFDNQYALNQQEIDAARTADERAAAVEQQNLLLKAQLAERVETFKSTMEEGVETGRTTTTTIPGLQAAKEQVANDRNANGVPDEAEATLAEIRKQNADRAPSISS